jgi:hypothetical protein
LVGQIRGGIELGAGAVTVELFAAGIGLRFGGE